MKKKFLKNILQATIYVTREGHRFALDKVSEATGDIQSVAEAMAFISRFQEDVATVVTVAMIQSISVDDFSAVEAEIDINGGFYGSPIIYNFQINPLSEEDYDRDAIESAINTEIDSVFMDMTKDITYYLLSSLNSIA